MKALTVIPVIDEEFAKGCIDSILMPNSASGIDKEDILIVDNTKNGMTSYADLNIYRDKDGHNLGVAGAWNVGAQTVLDTDYDYLTLMSASMLFGPAKETTWIKQMETFNGENVIEAEGHSWHLIAFHRRVFEAIGLFDTNFYPGYFEAIDFGYRMRQVEMENDFTVVWVNALSRDVGRHTNLVLAPPLLNYYRLKWGGDKGEETYIKPFNDKPLDYFEARPIPELAQAYRLDNWW